MQKSFLKSAAFAGAGAVCICVGSAQATPELYDGTFSVASFVAATSLLESKACQKVAAAVWPATGGMSASEVLKAIPVKDVPQVLHKECGDVLHLAMRLSSDMWLIQAEDGCLLKDGSINPDAIRSCDFSRLSDERLIGRSMDRSDARYQEALAQFFATKPNTEVLKKM